ncbi:MAG: phytanoyl-CoA dioxygenase family protein [Novosphingobium sp.]|nr:phytanoyl-CoA dioxygenase family protein [Novosphingobium sp.]
MADDINAKLASDGWCVVPGVISRDMAADAASRLWSIARSNAEEGYSCHLPGLDPNPSMVRVLTPLQSDELFRDLIENDTALELASAVVGQEVIVANCTANIALPGSQSMMLHSDLAFILPEPWLYPWSVNVVWCLSDVHKENGATLYIPGSHEWRLQADIPENAAELLVPFEAPAGSIIVMDGRLWHTSGTNQTADEERALLFAYYSASFLRPMINWTAAIPSELQATFSPRLRQLLSLDVFANTADEEADFQGHWKGQPVGAEQAMGEFRGVAARRSISPA